MGSCSSSGRRRLLCRLTEPVTIFVALAIGLLLFFFGPAFSSGFQLIPGDLGDWRFNGVIAEHWYMVLRGTASRRDPIFFFPAKNVLGHSDALFLFIPFYVPLRLLGADPTLAFALCFMAIVTFGFVSAYWLFTRTFDWPKPVALFLAFCFAFSSLLAPRYSHAQLFAVCFVPAILIFGTRFARSILDGRPSIWPGIGLSVGLAALLYTSFYTGYFVLLALAISGLIFLALRRDLIVTLWRPALLWPIGAFIVALVPFFVTYWPAHQNFGARDWPSIACMLPRRTDYLDGYGSYAWSWVSALVKQPPTPCDYELTFGFPLLTIAALLASTVWLVFTKRTDLARYAALAAALSVLFWWAMMLRTSWGSAWYAVYSILPASTAIRAVFRFQIVLHICALIAIGYALSALFKKHRALSVLILIALCLEQYNTATRFSRGRERAAELALVGPPPETCRQFFLDEKSVSDSSERARLDAVVIAQRLNIPTLNGYSAYLPPNYHFPHFDDPDYRKWIGVWLNRHEIVSGTCSLDLKEKRWVNSPR
jgi:hypothetical protein